jgi:hypothetical protein
MLITLLVALVVVALIFGLAWWWIAHGGLPERFRLLGRVVLVVLAVLAVGAILLGLLMDQGFFRP